MYETAGLECMPRDGAELERFGHHLGMPLSLTRLNNRKIADSIMCRHTDSNRYISFPSFDTWDPIHHEEHGEAEIKSP